MGRMQEIALELLGDIKEAYEERDDLTDLVKLPMYPNNDFYLGHIGRYEVWKSRSGFGVYLGDMYQQIGFRTLLEAVKYARELNDKAMAEEARYLAIRGLRTPASISSEATTGGRAPTKPPVEGTSKADLSEVVKSQTVKLQPYHETVPARKPRKPRAKKAMAKAAPAATHRVTVFTEDLKPHATWDTTAADYETAEREGFDYLEKHGLEDCGMTVVAEQI